MRHYDTNPEYNALVFLSHIQSIGPATLHKLMCYCKSAQGIVNTPEDVLYQKGLLSEKMLAEWRNVKNTYSYESLVDQLCREGITLVAYNDEVFPQSLAQLPQPPYVLYCRGDVSLLKHTLALAVVGTRKITRYGEMVLEHIIPELVRHNVVVVSGLALGVDGCAHMHTLKQGGKTVAVLGTGVDKASVYPRSHVHLAERMVQEGGLILSEYAPGTSARPYHFPIRNRIIAGLTLGTVVIEAQKRSGSLITALSALDQGREVFAVPGSILNTQSEGCHMLLEKGAHVVHDAWSILEHLSVSYVIQSQESHKECTMTKEEKNMLEIMRQPVSIDEICIRMQLSPARVSSTLSLLEIEGLIVRMQDGRICARHTK
jgi:DNA processing protein